MQWARIPEDVLQLEKTELYDLKFKDDYDTLLEKLEKRKFRIAYMCVITHPEQKDCLKNSNRMIY